MGDRPTSAVEPTGCLATTRASGAALRHGRTAGVVLLRELPAEESRTRSRDTAGDACVDARLTGCSRPAVDLLTAEFVGAAEEDTGDVDRVEVA